MHSSTLFLVAIASLMVSFTSAKGTSEGNAVNVNGIPQGNRAVYVSKRKLNKRVQHGQTNSGYTETASSGSPVGLDSVTGLLGGVSGGTGGLTGGLI